jgi:flagellin
LADQKIGFGAGDTITVGFNGAATSTTFTVGTKTLDELADFINKDDTLQGGTVDGARVTAKVENGRLVVESLTGDDITLTTSGGTNTAVTGAIKLFGTPTSTTAAAPFSAVYTVPESLNPIRASLAEQFEGLKSQIDQLIKDTGYNGVNLLNGDTLKVMFNETNTTSINIDGVVFNSQGLGLAPLVNGKSTDSSMTWQSDKEISAALAKLDTALNKVRSQASDFGSNLIVLQTRQDFTKQSILTLNAGSDLLTLADTSEEGANLLALQTRQQLSTQALAMASQTDQAVLRLFG